MPQVRHLGLYIDVFANSSSLRWNNGPYTGAFKRLMTVSVLTLAPWLPRLRYAVHIFAQCTRNYNVFRGFRGYQVPGRLCGPTPLWKCVAPPSHAPLTRLTSGLVQSSLNHGKCGHLYTSRRSSRSTCSSRSHGVSRCKSHNYHSFVTVHLTIGNRVTHLEELCFWLFLVNSGSVQQDWFRSLYFKTWIAGSLVAITYMPLVTILTRADPLKVRDVSRCS